MGKKKTKKLSPQEEGVMRTLIIDNGSQYLNGIEDHVKEAAGKSEGNHKIERITIKDLKELYDKGEGPFAEYISGFKYIISSGSKDLRKYDKKIHGAIAKHAHDSVFLGVCHGAQQYASGAAEIELAKSDHMYHGKRDSKVKKHANNPALENVPLADVEGEDTKSMSSYGHHKYYIPSEAAASKLEIIAESEHAKGHSEEGKKFVEMYKAKGKDHFGVQSHPEKGDGAIIKNLFQLAYEKHNKAA